MEFEIQSGNPNEQSTACAIVGVFERRCLSEEAKVLDSAAGGLLTRLLENGDMDGRLGQTAMLFASPGLPCERVLLVGCGKAESFGLPNYRSAVAAAVKCVKSSGAKEALFYLPAMEIKEIDFYWALRHAVTVVEDQRYRADRLKSKKTSVVPNLKTLRFWCREPKQLVEGKRALAHALAVAEGIRLARDLGNLPGNFCTPSYLADQASQLAAAQEKIETKILGEAEMQKLGMGALLSVSRGSREEAKLIVMEYHGKSKIANGEGRPIVLVGKGITFDAGGISLKPAGDMDEMKFDMCGAASVFGTLTAAARLNLPLNLVGIIPSSENLPDGDANKPGDIVTSMSGQTIEILNTDAEGRLVLCDALTYSRRYGPEVVIDIATLTGACVVALGKHFSGLMGNDQPLVDSLLAAGQDCWDRSWQLPLGKEYNDQLNSNFADMGNIGGRYGGAITAGSFLARFTQGLRWAHLDIAGVAWKSGKDKGATGRPVSLLSQYLLHRAGE